MKTSEVLTPILLAALILVVMISAALQQQADKQTQQLLEQLNERLAETRTVVAQAPTEPQPKPEPIETVKPDPVEVVHVEPDPDPDPVPVEPDPVATDTGTDTGTDTSTQLSEPDWPAYGNDIEQIIRQLLTGQYDAVYGRFNEDMRSALPLRTLSEVMNPLRDKHGAFDSIVRHAAPTARLPEGLHAFQVTVATKKTTDQPLVFTITLDDEKRIAGLYVR